MGYTILVAEEEPAVRKLLGHLLADAGYGVVEARCGGEALALLSDPSRAFAAAVLGGHMPVLSGPEVLSRVRPLRPSLPVVLLSGSGSPAVRSAAESDAYAAFLAKPFGVAEFVRAVNHLVGPPASF